MRIAIVIAAFNRPKSLQRLLKSLQQAHYHTNVDVIISIDNGVQEQEVAGVANDFTWSRGSKEVVQHNHHMGLKQHLLTCGSLAKSYDAFVLLEDDLLVSPEFFSYVHQALPYYMGDATIAGISLYHQHYQHALLVPFYPAGDNTDVYFMQYPSSWGAIYTNTQWEEFTTWLEVKEPSILNLLPDNIRNWPASSWKKWMAAYLVDTNKYYVYPRTALTTNMGDEGEHHSNDSNHLQVPLQMGSRDWKLSTLATSKAVYDVYMELNSRLIKGIDDINLEDIEIDLNGLKPKDFIKKEYTLTTKKGNNPIMQWGLQLKPVELNVMMGLEGTTINLCKTADLTNERLGFKEWWAYHFITPTGTELMELLGEKIKKKLK